MKNALLKKKLLLKKSRKTNTLLKQPHKMLLKTKNPKTLLKSNPMLLKKNSPMLLKTKSQQYKDKYLLKRAA